MLLEDNQWYGTMFPRIPAKHLKEIRDRIRDVRGTGNRSQSDRDRDTSRRERSRSPTRKKRRDPRDLDDRPSSSNNRFADFDGECTLKNVFSERIAIDSAVMII